MVARLFYAKWKYFMNLMTKQHVLGQVEGWAGSFESQKGDTPHAHMVFVLEQQDKYKNKLDI